jgi:hypothetical protein
VPFNVSVQVKVEVNHWWLVDILSADNTLDVFFGKHEWFLFFSFSAAWLRRVDRRSVRSGVRWRECVCTVELVAVLSLIGT